jgi:hypothetical protein
MRAKLLLIATLGLPVDGLAADVTLSFMRAGDPANLVDCLRWGPTFERPYTLAASGATATLPPGAASRCPWSRWDPTNTAGYSSFPVSA